jgi:hypothetical protein
LEQVTAHIDAIQKNVLDAMQKTTTVLAQKVDSRLDDQQKVLHGLETALSECRAARFTEQGVSRPSLQTQPGAGGF